MKVLFEIILPMKWVKYLLIPEINQVQGGNNAIYGKLLKFLGNQFQISNVVVFDKRDFCSRPKTNTWVTPFKLNRHISNQGFEDIIG